MELKINQLKSELDKSIVEADRLRKEVAVDETEVVSKKNEDERLIQSIRGLENQTKQVVRDKTQVEREVQDKGREIKKENEEIFFKKRFNFFHPN